MPRLNITGFAGSLSTPSRSRALVETAVGLASARFGAASHVFDLNDLGPSLGTARSLGDLDPKALVHVSALLRADALVIASPVEKGSYGGLFKHLMDLIDPGLLAGKPVLLAATGGGDRHALMIEHHLRPLFAYFDAQVLATGVHAAERDFLGTRLAGEATRARLVRAVGQLAPFLSPRVASEPDAAVFAPILRAL
ncbi:FMN reductase [Paracoccus limosus]|uniref:FMN reductase n=1 Tax=Paracoccus limosus TaxID=913252 RepID=A0A844H678_9RHOB|nr:NAD(P)H-dependent oxidoreductase [Paracoccus limosus]MTH35515.1 FMN reductase [Paracoccus limosus]